MSISLGLTPPHSPRAVKFQKEAFLSPSRPVGVPIILQLAHTEIGDTWN